MLLAKDFLWLLDCSHKEGERKVHSSILLAGDFHGYLTALTRKESVRYIALTLLLSSATVKEIEDKALLKQRAIKLQPVLAHKCRKA